MKLRGIGLFALGLVACGDTGNGAASASASAPAKIACKDAPPNDYEPRCKGGERECCALLVMGKKPSDPGAVDLFGTACGGGHVPACSVAREADKPAAWKLDALSKGCESGNSENTCRAAAFLGFALAPKDVKARFQWFCDHAKKADLPVEGAILACGKPDDAVVASAAKDGAACADGAFEHCQSLAGADGNSAELLRGVAIEAWKSRGFDEPQADLIVQSRVPDDVPAVSPSGSVAVQVDASKEAGAGDVDKKALGDALHGADESFRKCVGALAKKPGDSGGKVAFDVVIDARGAIAATVNPSVDLHGSQGLDTCVRGVAEGVKVAGVKAIGRAHVTLTLSK